MTLRNAETGLEGHGLLKGKRGLIVGVANDRSIAWGIAKRAHAEGAELAFTYQGELFEKRVRPLVEPLGSPILEPLDITDEDQLASLQARLKEVWGQLDFVVHSVAFADREDLAGRTLDTSRQGFLRAMDISAYSLISLTRLTEPLLRPGSTVLTLTYLGAVMAAPGYNVMGIAKAALEATVRYLAVDLGEHGARINALSAGPLRTLAASGVPRFRHLYKLAAERAPLRRNVELDEVGRSALYLLSDLSSGVTGEIHYVDAGFNITAF